MYQDIKKTWLEMVLKNKRRMFSLLVSKQTKQEDNGRVGASVFFSNHYRWVSELTMGSTGLKVRGQKKSSSHSTSICVRHET